MTGGLPDMIETMDREGIAAGSDGIFIETHFDPKSAKSDGANMLNINDLLILIPTLLSIDNVIKNIT